MAHKDKITPATSPLLCNRTTIKQTLLPLSTLHV